jgi:hypothetical protein
MSAMIADQRDAVRVAGVWSNIGQKSDPVTGGEEDVFALSIIDELAKDSPDFGVGVFPNLSGVDEIEEIVGTVEIGGEGGK